MWLLCLLWTVAGDTPEISACFLGAWRSPRESSRIPRVHARNLCKEVRHQGKRLPHNTIAPSTSTQLVHERHPPTNRCRSFDLLLRMLLLLLLLLLLIVVVVIIVVAVVVLDVVPFVVAHCCRRRVLDCLFFILLALGPLEVCFWGLLWSVGALGNCLG